MADPIKLQMLLVLNHQRRWGHVFAGIDDPQGHRARRRAKAKVARRSRRINRSR